MHSSFIGLAGSNRQPMNVCVFAFISDGKYWCIITFCKHGFRMKVITAGLCGPLHHLAPKKAFLLFLLPPERGLIVCWSVVMNGPRSLECEVWPG